jgi:hypothetical protein
LSRIRSAKPSWWSDQLLVTLTRDERFTYKGLIEVCCDDEGRFIADPRVVKGRVWPYDDDLTTEWVEATLVKLSALGKDENDGEYGRILLYDHKRARYGWVVRWARHQRVSHPTPSTLPPPPVAIAEGHRAHTRKIVGTNLAVIDTQPAAPPAKVPRYDDDLGGHVHEEFPHTAAAINSKHLMRDLLLACTAAVDGKLRKRAMARSFLEAAENAIKRGHDPDAVTNAAADYLGALSSGKETPNVARWRGYIRSSHDALGRLPKGEQAGVKRSGKYAYKGSTREANI